MKRAVTTILILMIPCLLFGQEIQEKVVDNFSGGLVNSISSPLTKDNEADILVNFNLNEVGWLERREGMLLYKWSGDPAEGLIPYYDVTNKLFVVQVQADSFTDDTAEVAVNVVSLCGEDSCNSIEHYGLYQGGRYPTKPFNVGMATYLDKVVYTQTKTEPFIYNGSIFYPMRPLAAGQPKAIAIDSGGTMTGTYRYKIAFKDVNDTSNFSAPSWDVTVADGKVFLWDIPDTARYGDGIDSTYIYRQSSDTGNYLFLAALLVGTTEYLDTNSVDPDAADTCSYEYGNTESGTPGSILVPGAMIVTVDTLNHTPDDTLGIGLQISFVGTLDTVYAGYSVLFEDTAGNLSMMSAPSFDFMTQAGGTDTTDWNYKATLTEIPVPIDSGIVKKHILRCIHPKGISMMNWGRETIYQVWSWFPIAEIDPDVVTYTDSLPVRGQHNVEEVYCAAVPETSYIYQYPPGELVPTWDIISIYWDVPGSACEECYNTDSLITFQPTALEVHGSRGFAVGNPKERHRVYYSDFGRFSTWPFDKTLAIPSKQGDWPNGLLSLEDRLLVFQQNSVYQVLGLSFSNFQIDEIIYGVGLTAPRSIGSGVNEVFFAHTTGIHHFSRFTGIGKQTISIPIKNSIDSISNLVRAWGDMFGEEYWFSVDSTTYIYTENPVPHWKAYSFGVKDASLFTDNPEYSSDEYILIRENDSLYQWGFCDTCHTDAGDTFIATYQSKPFFDEAEVREQIFYVDIDGSGAVDSLRVMILDKHATDTVLTRTVLVDFTDNKKDRVKVMKIVRDCTVRIDDFGDPDAYTLKGYTIGWKPWDNGVGL